MAEGSEWDENTFHTCMKLRIKNVKWNNQSTVNPVENNKPTLPKLLDFKQNPAPKHPNLVGPVHAVH